jgi:hypothetical protein
MAASATQGSLDMDEQCLHAFVVARGLLDRGTAGLDGTPPSAIGAVILFDVAVETAAKATLRVRAPGGFPGSGYAIRPTKRAEQQQEYLPWVLDQLLASCRELRADDQAEWPALRDARLLHKYRNTVQHDGTVPSSQDLERQRFRATDFIASLASSFFGRVEQRYDAVMAVVGDGRTVTEVAERWASPVSAWTPGWIGTRPVAWRAWPTGPIVPAAAPAAPRRGGGADR